MNDQVEEQVTDLVPQTVDKSAVVTLETGRLGQEIQAAIISAKKFPRDVIAAERRILDACKRKGLAEVSMYTYTRGGASVNGPSIRLVETIAQNYGNLSCGVTQLEQTPAETSLMAYCVDLETNFRKTLTFSVKNERHTKKGSYRLTDPRDLYENSANFAARRLRACILAVVPADIVDAAQEQCEKTLADDKSEPLADKIKRMIENFARLGVSQDQVEKRARKKVSAFLITEVIAYTKIVKSLADGMSKPVDWFEADAPSGDRAKDLTEKYKEGAGNGEAQKSEDKKEG